MSFWDNSPGPTWTDFLKSISPFSKSVIPHILNHSLDSLPRILSCPTALTSIYLTAEHSEKVAALLKEEYQTFPKTRICITPARIRNGFMFDGWIGCGVLTEAAELVGCCISRSLGTLRISDHYIPETGLVDFFCVSKNYRKQGIASFLLQELVYETSKRHRFVHIFMKEGLPLSPLPPIWQSNYIVRKRSIPPSTKQYLTQIDDMRLISQFQISNGIGNTLPRHTGDSQLFLYSFKGSNVYMCLTDTFHRSIPEGEKLGEILWVHAKQIDTPTAILKEAVETLVDNGNYDLILMDSAWPHDIRNGWKKDTMYGWYLFNCHPGSFFGLKPHFTF